MSNGSIRRRTAAKLGRPRGAGPRTDGPHAPPRPRCADCGRECDTDTIDYMREPGLGFECSVTMLPTVLDMFRIQVAQQGRYPRDSRAARIVLKLHRDRWIDAAWVNALVQPSEPTTAATPATTATATTAPTV